MPSHERAEINPNPPAAPSQTAEARSRVAAGGGWPGTAAESRDSAENAKKSTNAPRPPRQDQPSPTEALLHPGTRSTKRVLNGPDPLQRLFQIQATGGGSEALDSFTSRLPLLLSSAFLSSAAMLMPSASSDRKSLMGRKMWTFGSVLDSAVIEKKRVARADRTPNPLCLSSQASLPLPLSSELHSNTQSRESDVPRPIVSTLGRWGQIPRRGACPRT